MLCSPSIRASTSPSEIRVELVDSCSSWPSVLASSSSSWAAGPIRFKRFSGSSLRDSSSAAAF